MGACRSPALLCGVALLLGLAGSVLGGYTISNVSLTGFTDPLLLGSNNSNFMCNVTVTCGAGATCYESTLSVSWFRDGINITSDMNYTVTDNSLDVTIDMDTMSTSTLAIQGSVSAIHRGQYTCRADLNDTVSTNSSSNLMVRIPPPTATLTGGRTVMLGDSTMLTCTVNLAQFSTYMSIQNMLTINVELRMGDEVIDTRTVSPASMTNVTVFTLNNVNASNAGQYQCNATVSSSASNVIVPDPGNSGNTTLMIQLPQPTVSLDDVSAVVGSNTNLTCTVTLVQFNSYSSIQSTLTIDLMLMGSMTMSSSSLTVSGAVRTYDFMFNSVGVSNAGQYQCNATVTTNQPNVINPAPGVSSDATLYVVDSTVTASPTTVLDVSPYNNFTLTCSVTVTPAASPTISLMLGGNNFTTNPATITLTSTTPDSSTYQCNATVTVLSLGPVTAMDSTTVNIRGSTLPNSPTNVSVVPLPNSATISFTITSVAYTPETYSIQYRQLGSNLNLTSSTMPSRGVNAVHSFIGLNNEIYSIVLNDLSTTTVYFFRVVAMNIAGNTSTDTFNFTTAEAVPGPPSNPNITAINSTALTFSWGVPMRPNGVIIRYNYSCNGGNMMRNGSTNPDTTSVDLTDLSVFTNYTCNVSASTAPGEGPVATTTGLTGEEAPGSSPTAFMITQSGSTSLVLEWGPPMTPNGIITRYRYVCTQVGMRGEGETGSFSSEPRIEMNTTMMTTASVSRLFPFTNYNCSVYASTMAGQGPGTSVISTTSDDVPEGVRGLDVRGGMSDDTFSVDWMSPMIDNGLITVYSILVADYTTGAVINRTNVTAVLNDDENSYSQTVTSQQLEQGVPYNVSVAAYTSAGMGPAVLETEFTEEGIPDAVTVLDVTHINDTALRVLWRPLTIVQARGKLTGYIITVTPTDPSSRKRQAGVRTIVGPSASSAVVGGLVATQSYLVSVAGMTRVGEGRTSPGVEQTPAVVTPTGDSTVLIAAVVAIGVVVVLILTVVLVILIVCFLMTRRSTKLHTLTVKENEIALNIVDTDNGSNGKGIELKAIETRTALDEDAIRRCEPVPMEEFPQHCGKLHFNRDLGFEEEYETFKNVPKGSFMVSKLPSNTPKNRFENVYSFDDARVILPTIEGVAGSDYMNASYMNGYRKDNAYIAAQGPLPHTVGDFWRMVWELKLPTIVMLTELIERGIEKCHCYWPKNINRTLDVGFGLKVTLVEQKAFVEYKYKEIAVTNSNDPSSKPLKVTHYHFTAWPDHGVPADKTCMLAFIKRVRKTHPPDGPPLLVHCSAGVGRTGTFIVLDSNLQRMKAESTLNIYELITDMRTRRVLMVQTEAQYVYIHDALQEYIVCGDTSIPAEKIRAVTLTLQKVSEHKSGYQKQFELLDEVSFKPSESYCMDALAKENSEKNRFPQQLETLPYNNTRVRFRTMTGIGGGAGGEGGGSNYINASYVDGYKHRGAFLATQTPLKETVEDFWHMIWETQSKAIVMLCNLEEEGKDPYPQYWPAKSGELERYGKMKVKLISEKADTEFVTRKLELSLDTDYINLTGEGEDQFVVTQFHYTKWPEQGKPSTPAGMLKMMEPLLKTQQAAGNKSITVVCSDGVGRTGAFACIYSQLERVKTEAMADFFQYIKGSRFQRPGLVQTLDHYIYCHEVVCEFLSSFDNYHNFQGGDQ